LGSGFLVPLPRLDIVFWYALAVGIEQAEVVLRDGMSLLGQRLPLTQGCGVIAEVIGLLACFEVRPCGGSETHNPQRKRYNESKKYPPIVHRRTISAGSCTNRFT
jgi:hypothetical protein